MLKDSWKHTAIDVPASSCYIKRSMDKDLDKLFEEMRITRIEDEAYGPPFQGYGPDPEHWSWWKPYPVANRWNPRGYKDVLYRNPEGKLHRLHGPAYISRLYRIESWYKDGLRHREDGPAYIHNENVIWFYEGKLHRLDGPAVVEGAGPKQYWIHGSRLSPKEYKKEITRRKRKGLIR